LPKANASLSSPTKISTKQDLQTFDAWRKFFSKLEKNTPLHENLRKFFFWALKAGIPEDDFIHIKIALEDSPRIQKEPGRWLELQNGEWEQLLRWCKEQMGQTVKDVIEGDKPPVILPYGYAMKSAGLFVESVNSRSKPIWKRVYDGIFRVIGFHTNADTNEVFIEVELEKNDQEVITTIVPQHLVSTKHAIIKTLGKMGAKITEENASLCVGFIAASMRRNYVGTLKHSKYTKRLGFHGDTFLLPKRTLGEQSNLEYKGVLNDVHIEDEHIYTDTVRKIFEEWGDDAWVAGAALGYSLASPFVQRLRLTRNPILVLTGESGSGKSTLLKFALSALTPKLIRPFMIQGSVPNTPLSFSQNLAGLNGFPCLFDEINLAEAQRGNVIRWGDAAISFANGQTRMRGSKDNEYEAEGGESFFGILLGAGESLPKFAFEGIYNRQLEINVTKFPPFGVGPSEQGHKRAHLLERAMEQGAGVFGGDFIKYVLDHWEEFKNHYSTLYADWGWRFRSHTQGLALVVTILRFLGQMLNVNTQKAINAMLKQIEHLHCDFEHQENHPANRVKETICGMIASSEQATSKDGTLLDYYKYNDAPFFWKTQEGDYAIPSTSLILEKEVGDIAQYFKKWAASKFILPGKNKATRVLKSKIGPGNARCIVISRTFIEDENTFTVENDETSITPIQTTSEVVDNSEEETVSVVKREVFDKQITTPANTSQHTPKQGEYPPCVASTIAENIGQIVPKEQPTTLITPEERIPEDVKTVDEQSQGQIVVQNLLDEKAIKSSLEGIFWNENLVKLPEVLAAIDEKLSLPKTIWDKIREYAANYEEKPQKFDKRDLVREIRSWVIEEVRKYENNKKDGGSTQNLS
jgi:energy-coupling factor transporter ATP-binding protein EcfA2